MQSLFLIVQMVVSAILIVIILLQNKGAGFGRAISSGPSTFTRRGLEQIIFKATFLLVAILIGTSILQLIA